MVDELIKHLISRLDVVGVSLLIIAIGAVYIWYQHNSNKLLREDIELERKKRKEFIDANFPGHLKTTSPEETLALAKSIRPLMCGPAAWTRFDLVKRAL